MFINGVEIPYLITNAVEITQQEYDALQDKSGTYIITDAQSVPIGASNVTYVNTQSGLASTTVQGAIDELADSSSSTISASSVVYSNTSSGLSATNAQAAIDEISGKQTDVIASTLSAGATTVSFSDARITVDSIIEPYVYFGNGTDVNIIAPSVVNVTSGSCVLTFDAQDADTVVGIRVF